MVSGALRFFAASLLCHATTYAALALAITPMEGAVISAAIGERATGAATRFQQHAFLVEYDNNVGYCQNKAVAIKTGGDNAVHRNAQIQQDERGDRRPALLTFVDSKGWLGRDSQRAGPCRCGIYHTSHQ